MSGMHRPGNDAQSALLNAEIPVGAIATLDLGALMPGTMPGRRSSKRSLPRAYLITLPAFLLGAVASLFITSLLPASDATPHVTVGLMPKFQASIDARNRQVTGGSQIVTAHADVVVINTQPKPLEIRVRPIAASGYSMSVAAGKWTSISSGQPVILPSLITLDCAKLSSFHAESIVIDERREGISRSGSVPLNLQPLTSGFLGTACSAT